MEDGETSAEGASRKGRRIIETQVQAAERDYSKKTKPKIRRIIEH